MPHNVVGTPGERWVRILAEHVRCRRWHPIGAKLSRRFDIDVRKIRQIDSIDRSSTTYFFRGYYYVHTTLLSVEFHVHQFNAPQDVLPESSKYFMRFSAHSQHSCFKIEATAVYKLDNMPSEVDSFLLTGCSRMRNTLHLLIALDVPRGLWTRRHPTNSRWQHIDTAIEAESTYTNLGWLLLPFMLPGGASTSSISKL